VPHGYLPTIAAIAVPPIVDNDNIYDPICSIKYGNVRTLASDLIKPIRAEVKILEQKATLYYEYPYGFYNHVIINGKLVDNNGLPGKTYDITIADYDNPGVHIAIIPLPFIADQDLFDGCDLVDTFGPETICPDVLLYNFNFIAYEPPSEETVVGKFRKNYVDYTLQQQGLIIKERTKINLEPRQAIVNGRLVTKPAKQNQVVLRVQDYRFTIQFDKQRFYTIYRPDREPNKAPCYAYRFAALNSAVKADLPGGRYSTDQLRWIPPDKCTNA